MTAQTERPDDILLPPGWTWDHVEAARRRWGLADNMVPLATAGGVVAWGTINSVRLERGRAAAGAKPMVPALRRDVIVDIETGALVRDLAARIGPHDNPRIELAAQVVLASMFGYLGAREDRIAAYLGVNPKRGVWAMGAQLRRAGIWRQDELAPDCVAALLDDRPLHCQTNLALFAAVATCMISAWRRPDDGELVYGLEPPPGPTSVHFEGRLCTKCWTRLRYVKGGACVACNREYMSRRQDPLREQRLRWEAEDAAATASAEVALAAPPSPDRDRVLVDRMAELLRENRPEDYDALAARAGETLAARACAQYDDWIDRAVARGPRPV